MDHVEIGLVQINNAFSGQTYLPYAVGMLQAYVQHHAADPSRYRFRLPIYTRIPVSDAVSQLRGVQIAGFSVYVWNVNLSLAIAQQLKAEDPGIMIVFGGPQVPDHPEEFLRAYPFIDVVVHGEGEAAFCGLVDRYPSLRSKDAPSISYLDEAGQCVTTPRTPRMRDLESAPSPYLGSTFGPLMDAHPEHQWLALWETNRGCPFECVAGDTYIALPDKIVRCDEQSYTVPVYCGDDSHVHLGTSGDTRLLSQGDCPCVTVRLENGLSLTTTPDHLVTMVRGEQLVWRRVREITLGDWIACEVGQNAVMEEVRLVPPSMDYLPGIGRRRPNDVHFPETLGDDVAWLLGFIIGDGCLARDGRAALHVCLTPDTEHLVREKVRTVFHLEVADNAAPNTQKMRHGWIHSRMVVRFLTESCGIDPAQKLRVPRMIFESPKHIVRSFLEGLWCADGHQLQHGASYLTTVSAVLAQEVVHLIHWIGDAAVIRRVPYRSNKRSDHTHIYRVEWHGKTCRSRRVGTPCVASRVPVPFKVYRGKTGRWLRRRVGPRHRGVTRTLLSRLDPGHVLLNPSLIYTRVTSVEESGVQPVYDVSNPPTAVVGANGIRSHNCSYCDWGSAIASKVYRFDMPRLQQELEWFAAHQVEFIYCCDANYGMLPRDLEITQYAADVRARTGYPHALSVQNTKNATERSYRVQKLLSDSGLSKGVTIAFQSTDPYTLESIKRDNISIESFKELQRRFTRDRVETYSDLVVGLPGETYTSFTSTIGELVEGGQHSRIQFNNLVILPNAEMAEPAYRQRYGLATVTSAIHNIHGAVLDDEVPERQDLVISTASMPPEDWVKTRACCWMVAFLHFDKLFQIPLIVAHEVTGTPYRALFDAFAGQRLTDPALGFDRTPIVSGIWSFFLEKAREIQQGGPEYCAAPQWLNMWWPADEYMMIDVCTRGQLGPFFAQAACVLQGAVTECTGDPLPDYLLQDAVRLNYHLLKMPHQTENLELELDSNVWELYQGALYGEPIPVERGSRTYHLDRTSQSWSSWDDWCRDVVWYGNRRGAYFYGQTTVERQIAGHYGEAFASDQ